VGKQTRGRKTLHMSWLCLLLHATGAYPLRIAFRANRHTTLRAALVWTAAVWASWGVVFFLKASQPIEHDVLRYLSLSLSGCAGVAVLGARRPGVQAWNFVLLGLLVVLLLPLAEGRGEINLTPLQRLFLAALLAVPVLNYLPTRMNLAAMVFGCVAMVGVMRLPSPREPIWVWNFAEGASPWLLAIIPWLAWWQLRARKDPASEFDSYWLHFRDRFGLLWGQRVRDQFNRSAVNNGWTVGLFWQGLRQTGNETVESTAANALAMLKAILKRFVQEDSQVNSGEG